MQPSLDGKRFRVSEMGEQGEVSAATVFDYHEEGLTSSGRGITEAPSALGSWSAPAMVTAWRCDTPS
jgi:hypothetical protein